MALVGDVAHSTASQGAGEHSAAADSPADMMHKPMSRSESRAVQCTAQVLDNTWRCSGIPGGGQTMKGM